jgi:vancomycin resistance protein YoaR
MTGLELEGAIRTLPAGRRRRHARPRVLRYGLLAAAVVALVVLAIGFAYSGSSGSLPEGARVAGVDVGGLSPKAAQNVLERRALELRRDPVVFTAGRHRFAIRPSRLMLEVDWAAAVESARREGEGFGPVQGLRRIGVRVFGTDVTPAVDVYEPALAEELERLTAKVDDPHRNAAVRLRGLEPRVIKGREGVVLDRDAATGLIVQALAGFDRRPVELPIHIDRPTVRAADLAPVAAKVKTAVSRPVRLTLGSTRWRIPRWRIAKLLVLPSGGADTLAIGGPVAERYFDRLRRLVGRPPRDAGFAVTAGGREIEVVPHKDGRKLDVGKTSRALLAAALAPSPARRVAEVTVSTRPPSRTTAEARAMGIKRLVGGYTTIYGGIANRIHNVQLVSRLIDHTLIPPGAQFSFNRTTGERTPEKGFREAPVIINGELQTGLGGGVCQVSTTVFNAAYEAGLPIDSRTNHALYIDHYPQGRDATVNYPDVDLRFRNDTKNWLLLRTFVGSASLTVNLYGSPIGRRVESETGPLVETGPAPVKRIYDSDLEKGKTVVVESGSPSRSTSVRRRVYSPSGKLLYDATWYSSYRGDYQVIAIGTKEPPPPPKPKPEPKPKKKGAVPPTSSTTTTTPTPTTPTTPTATTPTTPTATTPDPLPQP